MYRFSVVSNQFVASDVTLLTLRNESSKLFSFQAGQYAALHFISRGRPSAVRCFSIVSSPSNTKTIQFAIKVSGNYSARVSRLVSGDKVYVQGPFGDFVLNPAYDKSVVMLAGGIGITPLLSQLQAIRDQQLATKVLLLYANRSGQNIAFASELMELAAANPNLSVIFVTNDGDAAALPSGARMLPGRIDDALLTKIVSQVPADSTYFLCGPPKFMDSISSSLVRHSVSEDRLLIEAFGQRGIGKSNKGPASQFIYLASLACLLFGTGLFVAKGVVEAKQAVTPVVSSSDAGDAGDDTESSESSATTTAPSPASTTPTTTRVYQQPVSTVS